MFEDQIAAIRASELLRLLRLRHFDHVQNSTKVEQNRTTSCTVVQNRADLYNIVHTYKKSCNFVKNNANLSNVCKFVQNCVNLPQVV